MRRLAAVAGLALLAGAAPPPLQYDARFLEVSRDWGMAVADYDNDGHQDLFITGHDPNDRIWYWTAAGYVPSAFVFPNSDRHDCDAADVDGDGLPDLYCAVGADEGRGRGPKELWIQEPGGSFHLAKNSGAEDPYGRGRIPLFFDLDHDGHPDLYLSNDASPRYASDQANINHVFRNRGDGSFSEVKTLATGARGFRCVAKGDVDGDGWDDLVVCNEQKDAHVYLNDRSGDFTELAAPAIASWRDARLADMDGDGRQDLVVLTNLNHLQVWLNTGSPPYFTAAAVDDVQPAASKGLTVGDFDRNGRPDVYVVLARLDCLDTLHDLAPDWVYWGQPGGGWLKQKLPQDYDGCGHQAATVDGDGVLLANGGTGYEGPSYLIRWLP